jgi:hypothetical protein
MLGRFFILPLAILLNAFPSQVLAGQILKTSGFNICLENSNITVQRVNIEYNNDNKVRKISIPSGTWPGRIANISL